MKKTFPIFLLLLLVSQSSIAQIQKNWAWGGPIDPLQEKFQVLHYQLELEIFPEVQEIHGFNRVTFSSTEKLDTLRLNLIEEYTVSKVIMDGKEIAFRHFGDTLDIFPIDCSCQDVEIHYGGKTPIAIRPPWTGGFTWEKDQFDNHWMGLSSQNEGAKIFMPCLDHPSSEAQNGVDLIFTAPKSYFVAANGRLIHTKETENKVTYHWMTEYPINNYNINFTLGVFHEESKTYLSADEGTEIPMKVYVLQENRDKAKALLEVLETSAKTHEKYFGPYPFPDDKIAVVETPYLGMEHQTINAYGNNYQFVPMGQVRYDWLLHHELGHEWFGNKVSVKDWADFWIHEGLTAYGDWLFFWEHGGEEAYHEKVASVRKGIAHARPVVSPRNSTSDDAYHGEIYTKGAYVIHSLRYYLGDELFFPMLKAFTSDERFIYDNLVETSDFTEFAQQYSGKDLSGFFDLYLKTIHVPKVNVRKKGKNRYKVSLSNIEFEMPVEVLTSKGLEKIILSSKPIFIESDVPIQVDPKGWYLMDK